MPFQPDLAPVAGNLLASALVSMLPLVAVFICLGVLKWKAHWACLLGVGVALVVAIFAFKMPAVMAISSGIEGAAFGIFPITWIVLCAIFLFELTVASGHHKDLMGMFNILSPDLRVLGILIGFCFCAVLECLAGFGAPVAIVGVMLLALKFKPMTAALTVLIGNTFAVPFGAVSTPVITGGSLTGIPYQEIGVIISRQGAIMVWVVPLLMLLIMDGIRGLKQVWPLGLVVGLSYSVLTWIAALYISTELTDMVAGLGSLAIAIGFLRVWKPKGSQESAERITGQPYEPPAGKVTGSSIAWALFPYLLIIVVFVVTQLIAPVRAALASTNLLIRWPFLWDGDQVAILNAAGEVSSSASYNFTWLSSPGTLLLLTGIVIGIVYRMRAKQIWTVFSTQVYKLRFTFVTIGSVLGLAYVMNLSGQTYTIGKWIAASGALFAFLSPILGWIGTAVTGSGTSATALFASLQQTAANGVGVDPGLLVGANTVGGAVGKMISPQTLAIAATAVAGKESDMLRKALPWSLGLLVVLCILVGLQSLPVLSWIMPS